MTFIPVGRDRRTGGRLASVIQREAVGSVRLTFTDAYQRGQAAGIRGNNASFVLFGNLGERGTPFPSTGCRPYGRRC